MAITYPEIYQCAYCGSQKAGHTLIRSCQFYRPHFACGECKTKNKKQIIGKPGWIYMIGYDEWWKIGMTTKSPESRVKELQIGNPNILRISGSKLVHDCLVSELFLHRKLAEFHHLGEWFRGQEEILRSMIGFDQQPETLPAT